MVEVFKTNVLQQDQAMKLVSILQEYYPGSRINFDLEDCDKILRIQHQELNTAEIAPLLNQFGFACEPLED